MHRFLHFWHTPGTRTHMGNSKFEHIVATIHNMNGTPVTASTPLEDLSGFVGDESTYNARATDFNIDALRDDDFFDFSRVFEFSPLEASTSSNDSTTTFFSFRDTSDESNPKLHGGTI